MVVSVLVVGAVAIATKRIGTPAAVCFLWCIPVQGAWKLEAQAQVSSKKYGAVDA